MYNVLIVDDDKEIVNAIAIYLKNEGYKIYKAYDGNQAVEKLKEQEIHLIILDIMMPEKDGIETLEEIRKEKTIPVIMLSAKSEDYDKIEGLNAGADDYLPKPFAASEFIARVKALGRRSLSYTESLLSVGNTTLDCNRFELLAEGKSIRLNNKEFQLMELFMKHPKFVFSTEHIMEKIWEQDGTAGMDVVWTYIGFLRKKLKQLGATVEIKTVRGAGYSLEEV